MFERKMPEWVKNAVFYEIYPQSFYDSNGDGIGDLPGIIAKLDYVKGLGADAIWLNPCFESPFQDGGYDISDFYRIAPRYGTLEDLKELFKQAHERGMKIILDLVAGHSSIEHPYFKASASREPSDYDDFYVWTRGWNEHTGPYRFISGIAERDGYFMINFFACQPRLNYGFSPADPTMPWQIDMDHPAAVKVQNELQNVMKFYLDMGCDGFRVDMAASLIKGTNALEGLCKLWGRYRQWMQENYPEAVLVSEWFKPEEAVPAGFHIDFKCHGHKPGYTQLLRCGKQRYSNSGYPDQMPSFFDPEGTGDAWDFLNEIRDEFLFNQDRGFTGIVTGNHDLGRIRGNTRSDEMLKMCYAFLFLLPGVPFLYYGDEIGMDNVHGLGNVEGSYNRSAARTPMQWNKSSQAGFSTADPEKFYLPIAPLEKRYNVEEQEKDPGSLLNFTRKLIALRKTLAPASLKADFEILYCRKNEVPAVYRRSLNGESLVVAVNPSEKACQVKVPEESCGYEVLLQGGKASFSGITVSLAPGSWAVWKK